MATARTAGRTTAQQIALEHLRGRIADGSLGSGDWIRQERIAEEIQASVVPVREALKVLEAEGQLLYVPHRGYQVRRLGLAELVETYRLRALLEDEAVRIAGQHVDQAVVEELEGEMDLMERASADGDLPAMTEANRRFHFLLYDLAAMPRMTDFIRQLWQTTDAYRSRYYADAPNRRRVNAEHREIVEALRRGLTDEAVRLLGQHRDAAVERLSALLDD